METGKLERNEGRHGAGVFCFSDVGLKSCLAIDTESRGITHHCSDLAEGGGFREGVLERHSRGGRKGHGLGQFETTGGSNHLMGAFVLVKCSIFL